MAQTIKDVVTWLKQWFYTEDEIDTALSGKQATLVSGTNIKTVNNESLLGSGNISISGGGGGGGSYLNDFYGDSSTNELVIDYTNTTGSDIVTSWSSTLSDVKVPSEKLTKDTIDGKANSTHTHTTSDITNMPTVPSASTTTPSADTRRGSSGSGTTWARADHKHPKSTIYAEASHNHNITDLNNVTTVDVTVTYSNNTSETIKLLKYTGS